MREIMFDIAKYDEIHDIDSLLRDLFHMLWDAFRFQDNEPYQAATRETIHDKLSKICGTESDSKIDAIAKLLILTRLEAMQFNIDIEPLSLDKLSEYKIIFKDLSDMLAMAVSFIKLCDPEDGAKELVANGIKLRHEMKHTLEGVYFRYLGKLSEYDKEQIKEAGEIIAKIFKTAIK